MAVLENFYEDPLNFSRDISSEIPIVLVCNILNNFNERHKKKKSLTIERGGGPRPFELPHKTATDNTEPAVPRTQTSPDSNVRVFFLAARLRDPPPS